MDELPRPIGPDVEKIPGEVLPEHVARELVRLLQEHADAVLEIRERHRRVWEEMLGEKIAMLLRWGLEERVADLAAANNLAVRKQEIDDELLTEFVRLQGELKRRLRRLVEDALDERADREGDPESPAA